MIKELIKLYEERRELTLLEIAYFALTIISFVVAGIVALFNQALGVSILVVPLFALIAGVVNIIAWSLVKLLVETLASKNSKGKTTKNTK